jgi:hypothetical protein
MTRSEVDRISKQGVAEYRDTQWGETPSAVGRTPCTYFMDYMENREGNTGNVVHTTQTSILLTETLASLPELPERSAILNILRHFLGNAEETEHLIDYLQEMWETIDLLIARFGNEGASKIIHAPGVRFSDAPIS